MRAFITPKTWAAAAAAALLAPASWAAGTLTGALYEGLGYEIVEIAPGQLAPVGFVNPVAAYVLPGSTSGGSAAGFGQGIGSAQQSLGNSIIGQRGLVITTSGSYALGTLGANSVPGWTPVGFGSSSAIATNASGLIVGVSGLYSADGTVDYGSRPVYYDVGSSVAQQLAMPGGFADSSGVGYSGVSAMSSTGVIVGYATQFDGDMSKGNRVLRWDSKTGQAQVLGTLPGFSEWGDNNASAVAVNAGGTIVGSGNSFDASGKLLGFSAIRWDAGSTQATALGSLGTAKDGTYSSRALAINDSGTVVGSSTKYSAVHRERGEVAVRWDAGSTTPTELKSLGTNTDGLSFSSAIAINNAGKIAGESQKFGADGADLGNRAVVWQAGGTAVTELALLSVGANGESYSFAFGMNNAGYVAGMANIAGRNSNQIYDLDTHAVVWTPDGQVIDLNTLLPENSGWILYAAYAISDSGWITGIGTYQPEGYSSDYMYTRLFSMQLAAVPEPASAVLMLLGVAGLVARRRGTRAV